MPSRQYSLSERLHLLLFLFTLLFSAPVFALTPGELVDIAGRQRMLSQRIIKAYVQAAQDVHRESSLEQLKASLDLFEKQMRTLQAQAPNQAKGNLGKVADLWKPFAAVARGPLNRDGAARLLQDGKPLLQACQDVVTQMEATYGISQTKTVNMAGRQRMLSQRITKAYMFLSWGFEDESLSKELEDARKEFESAFEQLRHHPQNTPDINAAFVEVERQWSVFRRGFQMRQKSGEYVPFFIAVAGDRILDTMDKITAMYARMGKPVERAASAPN